MRNIPLVGKTPEEVAQINKQIAMLTDEMGDYQARMRSSGDSVQVMIEGLQGVVAVAQGVTGALSAMGFDTEKLDKAMVQLIGVSQALATIHELNEKQTLKTVFSAYKRKGNSNSFNNSAKRLDDGDRGHDGCNTAYGSGYE